MPSDVRSHPGLQFNALLDEKQSTDIVNAGRISSGWEPAKVVLRRRISVAVLELLNFGTEKCLSLTKADVGRSINCPAGDGAETTDSCRDSRARTERPRKR